VGPFFLRPFLLPLSWLYGAGAAAHRFAYRSGLLKARRLPRPVVSVGNLSVGGGGKTPLVIYLVQELVERGVKVAVLSRGYGRADRRSVRIVSRGDGPVTSAALAGDEPYLIAARTRGAQVAVAPRRFDAGLAVLREAPVDLFLLDDGFSHHALARDLDIVTVDARRWFGDGRLIPAGILREPLSRLREADMLVVTKAEKVDEVFEQVVQRTLPGLVGWSTYLPDHLISPEGDAELPLDTLGRRKVFLFSGIADPLSFEKTAAPLCGEVVGRHRFPDHHPISGAEMAHLEKWARDRGAEVLLTTEKDLARLPSAPRAALLLCALVMGVSFLQGDKQLRGKLLALAEKRGD
jgi:tetraacyldisaccharide 4'-kinase